MIVTTGFGILVPLLGIAFPLLMRWLVNAVSGNPQAYESNSTWFFIALFSAATVCWFIGRAANARFNRNNPTSPDDGFGKKALRTLGRHTIFFVPMEYGALLIPIIGYLVKMQFGIY